MNEYETLHIEQLRELNATLRGIACLLDVKLQPQLPAKIESIAHCIDRRPDLIKRDASRPSRRSAIKKAGQQQRGEMLTPNDVYAGFATADDGGDA